MWFIKFWAISSIICYVIVMIYSYSMSIALKREYNIPITKVKYIEKVLAQLKNIIVCCIPFFNMILALTFIFNEKDMCKKAIEVGKYQKKENTTDDKEDNNK